MMSNSYRADIDGLRGLAVFSVVAFHCKLEAFSGGFVGVDIFFVISGYLICAIIHREIQDGNFSFRRFYARRAKRILPALFFMLLCCYVLASTQLTGIELNEFSRSAIANIFGASNIYFWRNSDYFSPAADLKPLMMTWSLSVEEQFYVIFPVAMLLVKRWKAPLIPIIIALTILLYVLSIWLTGRDQMMAFFSLPTRAWELSIGALLAITQSNRGVGWPAWTLGPRGQNFLGSVGAILLAIGILFFDEGTTFPGAVAAIPVLGAAFVIVAPNGWFNRVVLSWRPLVFIGLVSYSWYLWHWPILSFARLASEKPIDISTALVLAGIAFLVAILSWRFIEQPFRQAKHSVRSTLQRYATATAVILSIAAALTASKGWPQRFTEEFSSLERSGTRQADPCLATYGVIAPEQSDSCAPISPTGGIALIGDSHAAALAPALRTLAGKAGVDFHQYTKSSCPTLDGVTRYMPAHLLHADECMEFNRATLALVAANPAINVVVMGGYWSAPVFRGSRMRYVGTGQQPEELSEEESWQNLQDGLDRTIKLMTSAGKKVVLMHDVPIYSFDPNRAIAVANIPARQQIANMLAFTAAGDGQSAPRASLANAEDPSRELLVAIVNDNPGTTLFDPWAVLCGSERCNYSDGKAAYYIDSQHLSHVGARIVFESDSSSRMMLD